VPVPVVPIEGEASDGQRLALGAGFLDPGIAPAGNVPAVAHLRDDTFQPDRAAMRVHFGAVDLETFRELDVGFCDQLLQVRLALDQRQFSQVVSV
jgi:hypothetical protein